jgi:hypothetical protein
LFLSRLSKGPPP